MEINPQTTVPRYKWAREVKNLYNYTCVYCKKRQTGRLMHAHHIVPKYEDPSCENVLENGIALCHYCHRFGMHGSNGRIKAGGLADRIALVIQEVKECEVILSMPNGQKDIIKAHAEARGESVNGFLNRAIAETIERDNAATEEV